MRTSVHQHCDRPGLTVWDECRLCKAKPQIVQPATCSVFCAAQPASEVDKKGEDCGESAFSSCIDDRGRQGKSEGGSFSWQWL